VKEDPVGGRGCDVWEFVIILSLFVADNIYKSKI